MSKEIAKELAEIKERLKRLEKSIQSKGADINRQVKPKAFKGAKGGVLLLLEKGFLNKKKSAKEVTERLEIEGYIYSRDVVQNALNRLSKPSGPLISVTTGGVKHYAKRK